MLDRQFRVPRRILPVQAVQSQATFSLADPLYVGCPGDQAQDGRDAGTEAGERDSSGLSLHDPQADEVVGPVRPLAIPNMSEGRNAGPRAWRSQPFDLVENGQRVATLGERPQ